MNQEAHPPLSDDDPIWSITDLNQSVKSVLESNYPVVWVEGELGNYSKPSSGHWYFTLKDSQSQIRCAMFKHLNRLVSGKVEEGTKVLAQVKVSLYAPRGDFQLIVQRMRVSGAGDLQAAFEALKEKLDKEGLFDSRHKKPIPDFPEEIAVITSGTGAAIEDILTTLDKRFPYARVTLIPTMVQGAGSAASIIKALKMANHHTKADTIILGRGGGSLEDLMSFNDEQVARAIFNSDIPVITGIGHEPDTTIADYVSDLRAPTPTAAAQMATPDGDDWLNACYQHEERLYNRIVSIIEALSIKVDLLQARLIHPGQYLQSLKKRVEQSARAMHYEIKHVLQRDDKRLQQAMSTLHACSPLSTLSRGYAMVQNEKGQIITSAKQVTANETIMIKLSAGMLKASVEEIE